jgi:hypothetical protein
MTCHYWTGRHKRSRSAVSHRRRRVVNLGAAAGALLAAAVIPLTSALPVDTSTPVNGPCVANPGTAHFPAAASPGDGGRERRGRWPWWQRRRGWQRRGRWP